MLQEQGDWQRGIKYGGNKVSARASSMSRRYVRHRLKLLTGAVCQAIEGRYTVEIHSKACNRMIRIEIKITRTRAEIAITIAIHRN